MSEKLCSIGSVVKYQNNKLLIVGIKYSENDNQYYKKYLAITFPLGYLGPNSVRVLTDTEFEVVNYGYESKELQSFNKYYIEMMDCLISKNDAKTVDEIIKKVATQIEEETE